MADNIDTQSASPATLPPSTKLAAVLATFAGDSAYAGVGVAAEVSGLEGSRVLTIFGLNDSGIVAITTGALQAVPNFGGSTDYRLDGILLVNNTGFAINVQVTNGAGQIIRPLGEVSAFSSVVVPYAGMPITGLQWTASASGVTGHAWGRVAL